MGTITGGVTDDVAVDSYHRHKNDVRLVKDLKVLIGRRCKVKANKYLIQ